MTVLDFRTSEAKPLHGQRACTICGRMFRPRRLRGVGSGKACSVSCADEQRRRTTLANSIWTAERIETARVMWGDGFSAAKIAVELGNGLSRSAVIGKVNREHFQRPPKVEKVPTKRKVYIRSKSPAFLDAPMLAPEPVIIVADDDIPQEQRRTLLELRNHHCRFPIGDPQSNDFYFCGAPTADIANGRAYCLYHWARAHA